MIKAVFLDVDGTLFSHRISDIPASALEGITRLQEHGICVCLATGRHRIALEKLNLHGFPFDGYVTLTGHLCYDRDWHPVLREALPKEDTVFLSEAFRTHRMPIMMVEEGRQYINFADELLTSMMAGVSSRIPETAPYEGAPLYSAALYCAPEAAKALARELPGCRLSAWHPCGFDIISRSAGKVHGIEVLLDRFGITREETAVFGDADNDAEMLSWAGCGVAMGNGTERAKAAADFVTDNIDQDGLSNAFSRLGLLP